MWCERKKKTKCENINQPRIRLKNGKGRGSQPQLHGSCIPQIDRGESMALYLLCVCVCVFITHRSFTEGSHVNLLPSHFGGGVLTETMVWLVCWWKWKWGSPVLQTQQLIYMGINVASGSLGEGKEKDPLLNPEKDSRGLVFGEKPNCLNTVKHLHIRTAMIKSPFK